MKQSELVSLLHEEFDVPRVQIKAIVQHTFDLIAQELKDHGEFRSIGFGSFKAVAKKERNAHNPATGKKVIVPAKHVVKFTIANALKEAVA